MILNSVALLSNFEEVLNHYGESTRPLENVKDIIDAVGIQQICDPKGNPSGKYLMCTRDGHVIPYPPTGQQWNAFQLRAGTEMQSAFTDDVAKALVSEGCQVGYVETAWDGYFRTETEEMQFALKENIGTYAVSFLYRPGKPDAPYTIDRPFLLTRSAAPTVIRTCA